MSDPSEPSALLDFDCPRCGESTEAADYGPCEACRLHLRATLGGSADPTAVAVEYEPKMNVTPNAVALKE